MSAPANDLHASAIRLHSLRSLSALLEAASAEFIALLGGASAVVYLLDPRWGDLYGRKTASDDGVRFPPGQGIAGRAAKSGRAVIAPSATSHEAYVAEIDNLPSGADASALALPLRSASGGLLGVVEVFRSVETPFGEADLACAQTLAAHAGVALENASASARQKSFAVDLAAALAGAMDRMSLHTLDHTYRVREYCRRLADASGLDEDSRAVLDAAAVLHDIGRIELDTHEYPEGALDPLNAEQMKPHVLLTDAILRNVQFPPPLERVPRVIFSHHEHADGTGYPRGLDRDRIDPLARMLAVADAFDIRLYSPGEHQHDEEAAVAFLRATAGTRFDPAVVESFVSRQCYAIDQRRFPRIEYEVPADIAQLGPGGEELRRFKTMALDISEGGMLFRADEPIAINSLIRLAVPMADRKIEALAKVARVIRDDAGGIRIGAYFLWFGPAS